MSELVNQRFLYVPVSAFLLSLALHLSAALLIISLHVTEIFDAFKPKAKKSLYQDFIQVDMVALPDELPNQKSSGVDVARPVVPSPKLVEPVRPAPVAGVMVMPKDKPLNGPTDPKRRQLEQDRALKELEEEARREKALKALAMAKGTTQGRVALKGNILAQGNARMGELGSPKDIYDARVRAAIKEHFNVYSWQKDRNLVTVVHINLFPSGRVRKKKVVISSNDMLYDAAVLQAIDRAQPLPLPSDLSLIANGITVEFKPTE